jgi:hypothetical protein
MMTVRTNEKLVLSLALGALMLSAFGFAGAGGAETPACNKKASRGIEYPVMIHVTLEGKPVAAAQVEIATVHGVPLKKLKTDQIGVANYKLTPGDYIITASTADASNMVKITVSATSSVAVTVALTPTAKP